MLDLEIETCKEALRRFHESILPSLDSLVRHNNGMDAVNSEQMIAPIQEIAQHIAVGFSLSYEQYGSLTNLLNTEWSHVLQRYREGYRGEQTWLFAKPRAYCPFCGFSNCFLYKKTDLIECQVCDIRFFADILSL